MKGLAANVGSDNNTRFRRALCARKPLVRRHSERVQEVRDTMSPSVRRTPAFRVSLRRGTLGLGLLLLGALPACFITQEPDEAPWLVVYEPVEVDDASFLMALDRLGVVFEGDETEEQALLAFLGGRVIERRPGGLLVIELPVADRSELGGLARTIEETFPDTVASVGQIVHRPGDERPNLLCRRVRVAFAPDVPPAVARQTVEDLGGQVVFEDPDHPGEYLVDATLEGAQRFAERLQIVPEVVSTKAWPVIPVVNHAQEVLPFALQPEWQWHHRNTGQSGGVVDADVDTPQAWQMETGSVPLAVIDDGFEFNRVDFSVMSPWSTATKIFSNQVSVRPHGTKVAGLATARRDNSIPGSGSCPTCTLMPIQYGKVSNEDQLEAVRREDGGEGHGHQGREGSLHGPTINRGRLWAGDSSNFSRNCALESRL